LSVFLYYARVLDLTMLCRITQLSSMQANATEAVRAEVDEFLQYCASYPSVAITYYINIIYKESGGWTQPAEKHFLPKFVTISVWLAILSEFWANLFYQFDATCHLQFVLLRSRFGGLQREESNPTEHRESLVLLFRVVADNSRHRVSPAELMANIGRH
jgi:hypothetical protein